MKTLKTTPAMGHNFKKHLKAEINGFAIDFRNLSVENQKLLFDNVLNHLSPVETADIFILRTEE